MPRSGTAVTLAADACQTDRCPIARDGFMSFIVTMVAVRQRAVCAAGALVLAFLAACSTPLPDPQSAGGQVYQVRCSSCHALYAPASLTAAMWEVQVERMQAVLQHAGVNPLTEQERFLVLSYLKAHATDAPPAAASSGAALPRAPGTSR